MEGAASASSTASHRGADLPPNHTLYLQNLNEKVKKAVIRKELYGLFSQFGTVVQIIAKGSLRLKGQAWVVFETVAASTLGMRQMQNFNFMGKPLRISYAKAKSDAIAQHEPGFVPRYKRGRGDDEDDEESLDESSAAKRPAGAPEGDDGDVVADNEDDHDAATVDASAASNPPHHILLAQNLPSTVTTVDLEALFAGFPGFEAVRVPPGGRGVAFVDFTTEAAASTAMSSLQGHSVAAGHAMVLSYARRG